MALTGVLRPGHVQIRVLDLEQAVKHYTEVLGLIEIARGLDEPEHLGVVLDSLVEVKHADLDMSRPQYASERHGVPPMCVGRARP